MKKLSTDRPISVAVLAIGGQGGGVLTDWLVTLGEMAGWRVQSTSVPGVAQRTGATIYYLEFMRRTKTAHRAVLSLMPVPGEVDLVVAAEWMEAGRAVQRGLVDPQRTTLIASTHRSFAVAEKTAPGDGLGDASAVQRAVEVAAKRLLTADMQRIAEVNGSVISAALFGAICGAGTLPFTQDQFEAAIRSGGVGVEASLKAFAEGLDAVTGSGARQSSAVSKPYRLEDLAGGTAGQRADYKKLLERIISEFAAPCHGVVRSGVNRCIDFQDTSYGHLFLDYLAPVAELDDSAAHGQKLTIETARNLAAAMTYRDVIRVADLKTRSARFDRVRDEIHADEQQIVQMTEFMHPRIQEICGMMPVKLGRAVENNSRLSWLVTALAGGGKRLRTDTVTGFLKLYLLAGLRRFRPGSLRHAAEVTHIEGWLENVKLTAKHDYALAVEIARCQRLIKGYGDTHERGAGKYYRVMAGIEQVRGRTDAADWAKRLLQTALQDSDGKTLEGALKTISSFSAVKN